MTRAAFLVTSPRGAALRAINYAPELELLAHPRKGTFRSQSLGSLLSSLGDSYWSVFTRLDCSPEHGVELVSQTDMFASEPEGRIIRRDSMPRPHRHEVKRWQILIAGAGQAGEGNLFGRSIIADERLAGKFLGPHAVALTFADSGGDLNLWTYAFLNTSLGVRVVKACAFGTSVPGLRLDLLGDVPIPIPDDPETLKRVAFLVRRCVERRELYIRELHSARRVFESLSEMREAHAMCAKRGAKVVLWEGELPTMTARSYGSAGEALGLLRRAWSARVRDVVSPSNLFRGGRITRIPCNPPFGVDLYSQRDVFMIRPMPQRVLRPSMSDDLLHAPLGGILAASVGQVGPGMLFGRVELAEFFPREGVITEVILRIVPQPEYRSVLYAFLSTSVGQALLRTSAFGTSIPGMRQDLLMDLPVPILSPLAAKSVERHMQTALSARLEAADAESEAICILEEKVLTEWLA